MHNLKQIAAKLGVDITTVYRHYKRLCIDQGSKFNSHTTTKRGRLWLDGHAEYLVIKSFRHKHMSFSERSLKLQCKIKETALKSENTALTKKVNYYAKIIAYLNKRNQELKALVKAKDNARKNDNHDNKITIDKLINELDHAQTIADNAQRSEKVLDKKLISNKKPVGFLGWLKRHF